MTRFSLLTSKTIFKYNNIVKRKTCKKIQCKTIKQQW